MSIFYPLEVVGRVSKMQRQVSENVNKKTKKKRVKGSQIALLLILNKALVYLSFPSFKATVFYFSVLDQKKFNI